MLYLHGEENNPSARLQETIAMGAIRRIWTWLSVSRHQKTISFWGGGLVIVVVAAWQLFIYFYPAKSSVPPTQVIERFQTLSGELGVTQTALKNFFKIIQQENVPAEEYDSTLRKIAKTYKELVERLGQFSSSDPTVTALKEKAKEYLTSGDFEQAESFLNKAMLQDLEAARQMEEIAEARMISAAASMSEIGELKEIQLDYKEAASCYRRASESVPKGKGNDLILAEYLGKWGMASYESGAYSAAEKPLTRSLMINEKAHGPEHPDVATSLNSLALLYYTQGKYSDAEPLYKRSLAIREKVLGPEHPDVANSLNNLAALYDAQGKYGEAESLYKRSLAIIEKVLEPEHPHVAQSLNNLAGLYYAQGKYGEAEPLYKRSLVIFEKALGPDHPHVAIVCKNMAELYRKIGKKEEADKLEERAGRISSIQ